MMTGGETERVAPINWRDWTIRIIGNRPYGLLFPLVIPLSDIRLNLKGKGSDCERVSLARGFTMPKSKLFTCAISMGCVRKIPRKFLAGMINCRKFSWIISNREWNKYPQIFLKNINLGNYFSTGLSILVFQLCFILISSIVCMRFFKWHCLSLLNSK